ncbi:hypothetical protein INT43_005178 [Umbelopsis isabellina]|uniref:6-phosphogluconate dehydrogenase NADP-binding domain-containing protein n=1 Tax=Mortierella isabellina TaxID=91625 RepID=A0A8H7PH57_MORIS|nr:hypothetical protein INT43_005178 [Umbelopsis isabellina]
MSTTDHNLKFAYVGLGEMGSAMAQNLANWLTEQHHPTPLIVWNRSSAKAHRLENVKVAETLEEVAKNANVILSCLLNDAAVSDCYNQLFEHLPKSNNTIFCEMSTVAPALTRDLHKRANELGAGYLATPIFGLPPKARAAELTIIKAGDNKLRKIVDPYLIPALGKKSIELGEDVTEALNMKLTGNCMITGFAEVLAEGLTLAAATGVGQDKALAFIEAMYPNTPLVAYAKKMATNDYNQVAFHVGGAKKDVKHIVKLGEDHNLDLKVSKVMLDNLEELEKTKGENIDLTGVVGVVRTKAGLDFDAK